MAQQDTTTQAQAEAASQAAATEAGFTLFTHLARAPEVGAKHPGHRLLCSPWMDSGTGENIYLMRWAHDKTANLRIETHGPQAVTSSATTKLTADQCEALARALLDAAHDLRTHNSADLMITNMVAMVEGKEVDA